MMASLPATARTLPGVCLSASLAADSLADNAAFCFTRPDWGRVVGCRSAMICDRALTVALPRALSTNSWLSKPMWPPLPPTSVPTLKPVPFSSAVAEPVLMILRVATSTSRQSMRTSETVCLTPRLPKLPGTKPPSPILVSLEPNRVTLAVNMKSAAANPPLSTFCAWSIQPSSPMLISFFKSPIWLTSSI